MSETLITTKSLSRGTCVSDTTIARLRKAGVVTPASATPCANGKITYMWSMDTIEVIRLWKRNNISSGTVGKSIRKFCEKTNRLCVIHDLVGSCGICETRLRQTAGMVSVMEVAEVFQT